MAGPGEACGFAAPTIVHQAFSRFTFPSLYLRHIATGLYHPKKTIFATASPKVDTSFENLVDSLQIRLPSLTLSTFPAPAKYWRGPVRGLRATKPISKNETLVSVPSASALQVTTTADETIPASFPIPKETWRTLPWYARLALMVLHVKRDVNNALHIWTKFLPSLVDSPHHWSDDDLAQLQNDHIVSLIRDQRRSYSTAYNRICAAIPSARLSYDEFIWAVDCVRSRAFSGPLEPAPFRARLRLTIFIALNTLAWPILNVLPWQNSLNGGLTALFALIVFDTILPRVQQTITGVPLRRYGVPPVIDFLNHDSVKAKMAQVEFRYFTDTFDVLSGSEYGTDDQVFISYGSQSNDSFLQYYAFIEQGNPGETFTFDDDVAAQIGVSEKKLVARATGFDAGTLRAVEKRVGGDKQKAMTLLKETCRAQLDKFGTSIEEDTRLLKESTGEKSSRLCLAIQFRREKKMLLKKLAEEWNGKPKSSN